jgi:hypothetical protein
MRKRKLFALRSREDNPSVIIRTESYHTGYTYDVKQLKGKFFRVRPETSDFDALSMMKHREDKFAPAIGNGVIVTEAMLKQFDA